MVYIEFNNCFQLSKRLGSKPNLAKTVEYFLLFTNLVPVGYAAAFPQSHNVMEKPLIVNLLRQHRTMKY